MIKQLGIITNNGFFKTVPQATYASDDTSKGTIEERLTKLGFKEGSVAVSSGSTQTNSIVRYGNVCMVNVEWITGGGNSSTNPTFTVGSNFLPDVTAKTLIGYAHCSSSAYIDDIADVYIGSDGKITLSGWHANAFSGVKFKVAYMAKPI